MAPLLLYASQFYTQSPWQIVVKLKHLLSIKEELLLSVNKPVVTLIKSDFRLRVIGFEFIRIMTG